MSFPGAGLFWEEDPGVTARLPSYKGLRALTPAGVAQLLAPFPWPPDPVWCLFQATEGLCQLGPREVAGHALERQDRKMYVLRKKAPTEIGPSATCISCL